MARSSAIARGATLRRRALLGLLSVIGPGLMVMLADTDAGSVITAAQSGALWGYRLILPQLLLIPILYIVQEMSVRLGILTGRGHAELIRTHFGWGWAAGFVAALVVSLAAAWAKEFALPVLASILNRTHNGFHATATVGSEESQPQWHVTRTSTAV